MWWDGDKEKEIDGLTVEAGWRARRVGGGEASKEWCGCLMTSV